MTAHPGRIEALVEVPFARPRGVLDLRRDPTYGARRSGTLAVAVEGARLTPLPLPPRGSGAGRLN